MRREANAPSAVPAAISCLSGREPLFALMLVGVAALSLSLPLLGASLENALAFFLLSATVVLAFYTILRSPTLTVSPILFCFVDIITQCIIYPFYILSTNSFRFYLFLDEIPEIVPAYLLWTLGFLGLLVGMRLRRFRVDRGNGGGASLLWAMWDIVPAVGDRLVLVTMPMMLLSLLASYAKLLIYGLPSLSGIGTFASDAIRRNRGLGPLTLVETWSYVAVAYVGWHICSSPEGRGKKLALGLLYSVAGSALSLLNARRGIIVIHLQLLLLPLVIRYLLRRRRLLVVLPLALSGLFLFDRFSASLRWALYRIPGFTLGDVFSVMQQSGYAPLSFDHLELCAALMQKIKMGSFAPMNGRTFVAAALNWLPRSLFPNKMWTAGPYFAKAMGGSYFFDDSGASSSMTTGILVELVMNFGLFAYVLVPVVMMGIGYLLSAPMYYRSKLQLFALTSWSIYFSVWRGLFGDDMGGLVTKLVIQTSGLFFLYGTMRVVSAASTRYRQSGEGQKLRTPV